MKEMKKGTITSPLGFKTNAVACGIKKRKRDLALIYSIVKAQAAAVFTANRVKAAPVIIDREKLRRSSNAQAIVVNSGNANCCTGTRGRQDALKIRDLAAKYLSIKKNEVLIASTGVIGKFLPRQVAPMNKARAGHAAAVWNGRLYVTGGIGTDSSVEWYDLERNEWHEVDGEEGGLRTGRYGLVSAAVVLS